MVVAESQQIANDALELIDARYDAMDAVADVYAAMADGAPQLYEEYENNIALNWWPPIMLEQEPLHSCRQRARHG